jgi:hypothetical protein
MPEIRHFFESLVGVEPVMAVVWLGLIAFTVCLAVLMYTRWGQYRPLRKCMILSLLAHLVLACYATTIHIAAPIQPLGEPIQVSLGDGPVENAPGGGSSSTANSDGQPWEVFPDTAASRPKPTELDRGEIGTMVEPKRLVRAGDARLPGDPTLDHVAVTEVKPLAPSAAANAAKGASSGKPAQSIEAPAAQRRDAAPPAIPSDTTPVDRLASDASGRPVRVSADDLPAALLEQFSPLPPMSDVDTGESAGTLKQAGAASVRVKPFSRIGNDGRVGATDAGYSGDGTTALTGTTGRRARGEGGSGASATSLTGTAGVADGGAQPVPDPYRLRVAPNRADIAQSRGGTAATEAAVKAALKWLADNQDADGRWNPRTHEAGKETNIMGRNRLGAGSQADSAMTGLALLAFLASGHTHLEGPYRDDVRRGLEYLLRIQAADGNLAGQAAPYEFMYCHAIAAFALSEAYGMTHDARLREPVYRAVSYTLKAQDPVGGGWRYRPGDPGDTSQLGWQLMVLKSAELAGIPIPEGTRQGIIRFLRSVSSGTYGGRAAYRPGEQPTRTMTAEALVCWQFLGLPRQHPACNEAGDLLLTELPSEGNSNLYYWYYATLGMYQLQGVHWQRWNDALREVVVNRQVKNGPQAGSWNTDDLWAGYGGRVYSTALSTLTLEVYYRFLPLYAEVASDPVRMR